jgi:SAM-dependent methyltransferase
VDLYGAIGSLDACNFAGETLWRSGVTEGATYEFSPGKPAGTQYIREATQLDGIADGAYDVLLASHVIEHVANPLKALAEWQRVVRPDGALVIVVPHKDGTFDHRRPTTTIDHLAHDFITGVGEDDTTHLDEWLKLVDLERAPEAKPFEKFRERSLHNAENRGMHHHVFDTRLVVEMLDRAGLEITSVNPVRPNSVFALARKSAAPNNASFLANDARVYRASPFVSDRRPT